MNILVALWKQFRVFIVFIILEIIALFLIFSFNTYQNYFSYSIGSQLRANIYNSFTELDSYFNLSTVNKQLMNDNALLLNKLENLKLKELDTVSFSRKTYSTIPAKLVHYSVNIPENILIANKGKKDGVRPEMAVISSKGLVGIVYAVSDDYASIMPLINTSFSALVSFGNYTLSANTSWNGEDYRYIYIKNIPLHISVNKGDTVFTNNNSMLYPNGEIIGFIEDFEKDNLAKSYILKVKLSTDFSQISYVYFVQNNNKNQIDSLLQNE